MTLLGRTLVAAGAAVALAFGAGPCRATDQAGVAGAVRGQVRLDETGAQIGHLVKSGEPIFLGNKITSGTQSGLQIMLLDQTVFTVGPESELVVDTFVYDPKTRAGKVAATISKGVFRFITGKIAERQPSDMEVRLASAVIGVRGTVVAGRVTPGAGGKPPREEIVLLGPGPSPQSPNIRPGAILVSAAGREIFINRPGLGTVVEGGTPSDPIQFTGPPLESILSDLQIVTMTPGTRLDGSMPGQPGGGFTDDAKQLDQLRSTIEDLTRIDPSVTPSQLPPRPPAGGGGQTGPK